MARRKKRFLALALALTLIFLAAIPGVFAAPDSGEVTTTLTEALPAGETANGTIPRRPMAENDGVPPPPERLRAIAAARPANASDMIDTDKDGLPDIWETNGADFNGDGVIDLPLHLMGASVSVPDVFVEVDWMAGRYNQSGYLYYNGALTSKPDLEVFGITAAEYVRHGIRLHIDYGPESIDYVTGTAWKNYPGGSGGNEVPYSTVQIYDGNGTNNWASLTKEHLTYLRSPVFHHSVIVDSTDHIGGWGGWEIGRAHV